MEENIVNVYLSISFFAILGVIIRIELNKLESDLLIYLPLILTNSIGCILLGFINNFKLLLSNWQYAFYIGLSTGLCGSITTFSSWNLAIFRDFFNLPSLGKYSYINFITGIVEIVVSLTAYTSLIKFGSHLGKLMPFSSEIENDTTTVIKREKPELNTKFIIYSCLTLTAIVAAIILTIVDDNNRKIWISCLLAPFGGCLRYILSFRNSMYPNFPLGTFLANIIGTLCLGIFFIFRFAFNRKEFLCHFLIAVADGFCGCLTTISTFINELVSLNTKYLYFYCISSIVVAQIVLLITFGFYGWSSGLKNGMINC